MAVTGFDGMHRAGKDHAKWNSPQCALFSYGQVRWLVTVHFQHWKWRTPARIAISYGESIICHGTSSTRAHGARSINAAVSAAVSHNGTIPSSAALRERRRTVSLLIGEYWASQPMRRPPGPVTSTSVTRLPVGDLTSISALRLARTAARAMRCFMALCLALSSGVALCVTGRWAALRMRRLPRRNVRIVIQGDFSTSSDRHTPPSRCSRHSSRFRSRWAIGWVISSSRLGRSGCPRSGMLKLISMPYPAWNTPFVIRKE